MNGIAISKMTFDEALAWKSKVGGTANQLRVLLSDGYERGAWEVLGYATWTECVRALAEEYGFTERRLWQLHAANQTERLLNNCSVGELSEGVLRPLTVLEPEQQREVWQRAVETAPNGKVTAAHVQTVVNEYRKPAEMPTPYPLPALAADDEEEEESEEETLTDVDLQVMQVTPPTPTRMAVHFSSETPEHYTPRIIIDAAVQVMGGIDLDPCSNSKKTPTVPATEHYTIAEDGLIQYWSGRVYMNPPYGREIGDWVTKLTEAYNTGDVTEAIALVPGRIDTEWYRKLTRHARMVCHVSGRLTFIGNNDPAPFPSVVAYLGDNDASFYEVFGDIGEIWQRVNPEMIAL